MKLRTYVIGVFALITVSCGDSSTTDIAATAANQPASTVSSVPAQITTAGIPSDEEVARAAMAAWRAGDAEGFLSFFAADASLEGFSPDAEEVKQGLDFWMATGWVPGDEECRESGFGISCRAAASDRLSGSAGVVDDMDWNFAIADGQVSDFNWVSYAKPSEWFEIGLTQWLRTAYPDVWAGFAEGCVPSDTFNCHDSFYADAEKAAVLLEYAPEFIAESSEYPIGG